MTTSNITTRDADRIFVASFGTVAHQMMTPNLRNLFRDAFRGVTSKDHDLQHRHDVLLNFWNGLTIRYGAKSFDKIIVDLQNIQNAVTAVQQSLLGETLSYMDRPYRESDLRKDNETTTEIVKAAIRERTLQLLEWMML